MAYEIVLPDCSIDTFRSGFLSKTDYRKKVTDMSIKQQLFDRQHTNALEANLHKHIIDKALTKVGAGGFTVTSYLISSSDSSTVAYLSYAGGELQMTAEGRDNDMGYFLTASPSGNGIRIRIESKREYYKFRTWAINAILIVIGLIFAVIPGLIIGLFLIFVEPYLVRKKIDKFIVPAIETTFGKVQVA